MDQKISLPNFESGSVLVVGDVILDSYWYGPTLRISPEAPVPVVKVDREETRIGGAGNVATSAAALGARTQLIGLTGQDAAADDIEVMLKASGVSCYLQRVPGSKTIKKLRVMSRNQQLIRLDFEDHFPNWDAKALQLSFETLLSESDVMILSDYAKGSLRLSSELVTAARRASKPVIIDPKGTEFERYRGATLITPNFSEFEAVVGSCDTEDQIERRGIDLRDSLDLEALLITRGEKGMTLLARGHEPIHLPTQAQEVFDVTGAGDTVVATTGAALAAGMSMPEAVTLSNIAAGIVVAKLGTATVSSEELQRAIYPNKDNSFNDFLSKQELLKKVEEARAQGECVVMTNGCFDILHLGHIDYLEKARELGDRLIVAINDDASTRRLKGDSRPVNTLITRMRMISALSSVDWVVSFSENTPESLYSDVLPDILVKGGDYSEDQVAGSESVKAAGGEVRIISFLDGHSTTDLINKIKKRST